MPDFKPFLALPVFSRNALKSHESFSYVSPDVFSVSFKSLIINILQEIVRVSFSAPNASQSCGAFLFGAGAGDFPGGWEPRFLYILDNQTPLNHRVPNLDFFRGVGNHALCNQHIINHL